MSLDERQRQELGKALFDIGKLSFGVSVATPLVASGLRVWRTAAIGMIFVVIAFALATHLLKKEER